MYVCMYVCTWQISSEASIYSKTRAKRLNWLFGKTALKIEQLSCILIPPLQNALCADTVCSTFFVFIFFVTEYLPANPREDIGVSI